MNKEQKEMFDKIVGTGSLNKDQIERLRAGFEKKPRQINIKKSQLHLDKVASCKKLEKINPEIEVDWSPEDSDGDAYIYIIINNHETVAGNTKAIIMDAMSSADIVNYSYVNDEDVHNKVIITLGFTGIIKDPNKADNTTAN